MMTNNIDFNKVQSNFETFKKLCSSLEGPRKENVLKLVDDLGERLALAPASTRKNYHNAFPGGLVDHSLRVLLTAKSLSKSLDYFKNVSSDSLVLVSLFHDLGKVGEARKHGQDYYVPQESSWHQEKLGEFYTYNEKLSYMSHSLRSLYLLQHYNVHLSEEEYLAIYLHDGLNIEQNRSYAMKEPKLAILLHQADFLATKEEKELG